MNVLFVTAEASPYLKTGGLGDVSEALPLSLASLGMNVRIVTPHYRAFDSYIRNNAVAVRRRIPIAVMLAGEYIAAAAVETIHPSDERITVWSIECPVYFDRPGLYGESGRDYPDNAERFIFFNKACIELIRICAERGEWTPDVVHSNDWHTAVIAFYITKVYSSMRPFDRMGTVFTIHNLAYQGVFSSLDYPLLGADWAHFTDSRMEHFGNINFMKSGIACAHAVTTVSPTYAREILSDDQGFGLAEFIRHHRKKLTGILNGARYETWSPEKDTLIPSQYSARDLSGKIACKKELCSQFGIPYQEGPPVIGIVSRLTMQKGLELVLAAMSDILRRTVVLVVLGVGDIKYEASFSAWRTIRPSRVGVHLAFSDERAHLVEAGSDMFLMPSLFEPCGLNQMYSLRYGTVPIVRFTGGLADTIIDRDSDSKEANGFTFREFTPQALLAAIDRALAVYNDGPSWKKLMMNGMRTSFSWDDAAAQYSKVYAQAKNAAALRKNKKRTAGKPKKNRKQ